ncbi:MAG: HD domain-containing protein, partial [Spirochaetia bacterium]
MTRLEQQITFIKEIDKLKTILRMTRLTDSSRRENSAEHSWHIGIMAFILSEYGPAELDLIRVMKMLLIHDIVEIDAGDTFLYDEKGHQDKAEREEQAANRIFGLLPDEQGQALHDLWREYEERKTPEAKYA